MFPIPKEFEFYGIYMPPMLVAGTLALIAAVLTARYLNRFRLSRFIAVPPLAFLGLVAIYATIIGTFVIPA